MAILKWLLILVGLVVVVIFGLGAIGYNKIKNAPVIAMTPNDLLPGGSTSPQEHEAFYAACQKALGKSSGTRAQLICGCMVTQSESRWSRAERIVSTASWNGDFTAALSVGLGLSKAGIAKADIEKLKPTMEAHMMESLSICMK